MNEPKHILDLIGDLGYTVSLHRVNGVVEMHAVQLVYPCAQHIARVIDGDGPEEDYRCACALLALSFPCHARRGRARRTSSSRGSPRRG